MPGWAPDARRRSPGRDALEGWPSRVGQGPVAHVVGRVPVSGRLGGSASLGGQGRSDPRGVGPHLGASGGGGGGTGGDGSDLWKKRVGREGFLPGTVIFRSSWRLLNMIGKIVQLVTIKMESTGIQENILGFNPKRLWNYEKNS